MPDYRQIYARDAERYHELVVAEDYLSNLPRELASVASLRGARVVELGMGTGRVTRQLIDAGAHVSGFDESAAMIAEARRQLGARQFTAAVADARTLELPGRSADVAVAGWMLGHFCEWYQANWQQEIDGVLRTMWGALDVGGTLIVIETLGTGSETPHPPNAELAAYYAHLEQAWGMQSRSFRTDYRFASVSDAAASFQFFFGEPLAQRVREQNLTVIAECTGLWWRKKESADDFAD